MKKTLCMLCLSGTLCASLFGCGFLTESLVESSAPAVVTQAPSNDNIPVVTDNPTFNTNAARTSAASTEDICGSLGIQNFKTPQEAENISCSIIGGNIGEAAFEYRGVDMYYRTAKTTTNDISGLGHDLANQSFTTIDVGVPSNNATVFFYSFNNGQERMARWKFGDTQYCLVCTEQMRESTFTQVAEELGQGSSPDWQQLQ